MSCVLQFLLCLNACASFKVDLGKRMFLYEAKQDPEVAKCKLIDEIEKKVLLAGRITLWPQLSWQC